MTFRFFTSFIIIILSTPCFSQVIEKDDLLALDCISKGYVTYGLSKIKKSSDNNSVAAQYYMGQCLENGFGVDRNLTEAFRYYRKAAERGLPDAMYRMAMFYGSGTVVVQNDSRKQQYLTMYERKGGKCLLPDLVYVYNQGLTHPENYAEDPFGDTYAAANNNSNIQNKSNVNSNSRQAPTNITIVQQITPQSMDDKQTGNNQLSPKTVVQEQSDVDIDIPVTSTQSPNTFALIIANEDYQNVVKVPNALNDGRVFSEYCEKTLGLPKTNIHLVENATFNNIRRNLNIIKQIADAYKGEARFIVYYAGHGLPDESSKNSYLMPVDGDNADATTCYSLTDFYKVLGQLPSSKVVVLLDACFSGSLRGQGMLASARGVAIKAKSGTPQGKMLVLSAAQGDETAYPFEEQKHGLFTYFLLKKIKDTQGNVTLDDLFAYVKDNVVKKSIVVNAKQQTPSCSASSVVADIWKTWTLK